VLMHLSSLPYILHTHVHLSLHYLTISII
jgi:hypothetical protein